MKPVINGHPVPYDLPKEELYTLLASDSMTDFVLACEALSALPDADVCDRLGAYLTSPDKYRRLAVLKVIFRHPAAVKYTPILEEAILSEDILFAESGLRAAAECRAPVSESAILTATRRHIAKLHAPTALCLLAVSEENYEAITDLFSKCVTSLQQEVVAELLLERYADTHPDALFSLLSASRYPAVRRTAAWLGLRFGFDLTALQNDPDGHVRKAAFGQNPPNHP